LTPKSAGTTLLGRKGVGWEVWVRSPAKVPADSSKKSAKEAASVSCTPVAESGGRLRSRRNGSIWEKGIFMQIFPGQEKFSP